MTYFDAYIMCPSRIAGLGRKAEPAEKDIPTSPLLPEARDAFVAIRDAVVCGRFPGCQVDWGSWAALMTPREIAAFLVDIFGPRGAYEAQFEGGPLQHLADQIRAFRAFVDGLPKDRVFAVVGEEF